MKKNSLIKILALIGMFLLAGMMCFTQSAGQGKEKQISERPYL